MSPSTPQAGDPRFYRLLEDVAALHGRQSHEYAPTHDPLANFKLAELLGVPAWKGVLVRMTDKWARIAQLCQGVQPKTEHSESLRDALLYLALYSLLTIALMDAAHDDYETAVTLERPLR